MFLCAWNCILLTVKLPYLENPSFLLDYLQLCHFRENYRICHVNGHISVKITKIKIVLISQRPTPQTRPPPHHHLQNPRHLQNVDVTYKIQLP